MRFHEIKDMCRSANWTGNRGNITSAHEKFKHLTPCYEEGMLEEDEPDHEHLVRVLEGTRNSVLLGMLGGMARVHQENRNVHTEEKKEPVKEEKETTKATQAEGALYVPNHLAELCWCGNKLPLVPFVLRGQTFCTHDCIETWTTWTSGRHNEGLVGDSSGDEESAKKEEEPAKGGEEEESAEELQHLDPRLLGHVDEHLLQRGDPRIFQHVDGRLPRRGDPHLFQYLQDQNLQDQNQHILQLQEESTKEDKKSPKEEEEPDYENVASVCNKCGGEVGGAYCAEQCGVEETDE